ncbi:MAG: glycosyltransferase family 2 protein [Cyanobacteria bacterium P01_H01_bin.105]
MKMLRIKISLVIPVYNGGESFRVCLNSISRSHCLPDELIVVSDGDTDGSWAVAEAFGAKVFRLPSSQGPAHARNVGAKAATGDIIFFVDADVTLHPETVGQVKHQFQKYPKLAALIGSYDDEPGAENFLSQYKNLFHHYTHQMSSINAFTFWGACGAIRRSIFQDVGGFDETYCKPCIEDIELGYRLKRAGHVIQLGKDIQVKHLKRWGLISLLRAEIFYRALPWTKLILRDRRFDADLNLSHANRLSVIFAFLFLGSLATSALNLWLLLIATILGIGLLVLNFDIYFFFYRKRGFLFVLQVIPCHWSYFLYGGAAFAYGTLSYYLERLHWNAASKM